MLATASMVVCQQRATPAALAPAVKDTPPAAVAGKAPVAQETIGTNDQLVIMSHEVGGLGERPYRVEADGTVTLPLVGKVRAEGFTVPQFEKELTAQFAVYVRSPQVTVRRLSSRADTIVVSGAFNNPGIYALSDRRAILDVLAAVGGLRPNSARTIRITRRLGEGHRPLPSSVENQETGTSTARINLSQIMEAPGGRDDLIIEPYDILYAGPSGTVYMTGAALRVGAFELGERDSFGLTELVAMAGGLRNDAALDKIKILRPILDGTRRAEIKIDGKAILEGRVADFRILPSDTVVVPVTRERAVIAKRALLMTIPIVASSLIYVAIR